MLAVLLSICSEADAFVAASLSQFSLTARLVFLVVGPMVDRKLISMQMGAFGRRFAFRFAPATFGTFKNYYFAGLPHFADSVYTEWGNTYSVVCLETTGSNYAWLKYMQCWGF